MRMASKSTELLVLLIFTAFWFYQLYKIWFQVDKEYEKAIKRTKWMPILFNTERQIVKDKQSWIMFVRVLSILMTIFFIILNVAILPSLIFGK